MSSPSQTWSSLTPTGRQTLEHFARGRRFVCSTSELDPMGLDELVDARLVKPTAGGSAEIELANAGIFAVEWARSERLVA